MMTMTMMVHKTKQTDRAHEGDESVNDDNGDDMC